MNRPTLILLVGPPGVGKTTYATKYIESHSGTVLLSSDKIRKELWGDETIQDNPNEVFSLMQNRAVAALNFGSDVIYDATNMTRKDRSSIIAACPKFVKIEAHIVWAPIEACIERDATRKRTVGKEVIDRMLKRFQAPYYDEGIDEIKVILPDNWDVLGYGVVTYLAMRIPHDNPHHTLDVQEHCNSAFEYAYNLDDGKYDQDVTTAAMYHDIGKPYVKAFVDSKGNPCDIAHYYSHQCIGSWVSYGIEHVNPHVAWLISTHMDPFLNTKYYNKLPTYLKTKVDLLHEADLAAH